MGILIPAKQWHELKDTFPNNVSNMASIVVSAHLWEIKSFWKNKNNKTINNLISEHTDPVGAMIAWCKEFTTNNFYVEIYRNPEYEFHIAGVKFYFFDKDDAILFKLTWC